VTTNNAGMGPFTGMGGPLRHAGGDREGISRLAAAQLGQRDKWGSDRRLWPL